MNRNGVAASVRKNREAHPELYCPVRNCLWRLSGGACPKLGHHKVKVSLDLAQEMIRDAFPGIEFEKENG